MAENRKIWTKSDAVNNRCELTITELTNDPELNVKLAGICPICKIDVAWHSRGTAKENQLIELSKRESKPG